MEKNGNTWSNTVNWIISMWVQNSWLDRDGEYQTRLKLIRLPHIEIRNVVKYGMKLYHHTTRTRP
jgi:hypothetical protein